MNKTNAMRLLDKAGIKYECFEYEVDENDLSGIHIARQLGLPCEIVFKTLTARGDKNGINVFCVPVNCEIDLKKAAAVSKNKRVELLSVKELLPTTGYIRGGCSPVGMKKKFPTYIDETAMLFEKITVSSGVRGCQLMLSPVHLAEFTGADFCDIIAI